MGKDAAKRARQAGERDQALTVEQYPMRVWMPPVVAIRYGWQEHPNQYPEYVRRDLLTSTLAKRVNELERDNAQLRETLRARQEA